MIAGLREFREHLGGELHITLLRGIGNSFEVTEMDEQLIGDRRESLAEGRGLGCDVVAASGHDELGVLGCKPAEARQRRDTAIAYEL